MYCELRKEKLDGFNEKKKLRAFFDVTAYMTITIKTSAMDIVDIKTRSHIMSKVPQKNTSPEIKIRSILHSAGLRFRLHSKKLPGTPDIVLPRYGVAILVHGCFWHYHRNCRFAKIPQSNFERWKVKLERNVERDQEQINALEKLGWRVVVVWSCALRGNPESLKENLVSWIRDPSPATARLEIGAKEASLPDLKLIHQSLK